MWDFIRKLYFEHVVDEDDPLTRGFIVFALILFSLVLACLGLWLF